MDDELDLDKSVDAIAGDLGIEKEPGAGVDSSSPAPGTGGSPAPAIGVADELLQPPKTWSKEAAALYASLPELARKEIRKREADALNGITKYKSDAEWAMGVRKAFDPYRATLQTIGVNEAQAIQTLMGIDHTLRYGTPEQKAGAIRQMVKAFGIDPKSLTEDEPAYTDPAMKPLLEKVSKLEATLTQTQRESYEARRAEAQAQVEAFASDPTHQYFDEVADDISKFIDVGYSLEEAYDKAVWANPVTRAKEQARLKQEAEEKVRKDLAEAARGAKKATAANVKASPKEKSATAPIGSIDDTLAETLNEIRSRVH
jgi:hypothetical protein